MKKYSEVTDKIKPSNEMTSLIGNAIKKSKSFDEFCFEKQCCYQNENGGWVVNVYPMTDFVSYYQKHVEQYVFKGDDSQIFDLYAHRYETEKDNTRQYKHDMNEFCPMDFWGIMWEKYKFNK
jgi:hypothetical protein